MKKKSTILHMTAAFCAAAVMTMSHTPILQVLGETVSHTKDQASSYVVADWKFNQKNSSGSLENNDLTIEDQSGNDNDLRLVTSSNGAKAADFLSFEDHSITGKDGSIRFNGLKPEQNEEMSSLSGTEKEEYVKNTLEYAYFETVDGAEVNTEKFEDGYTIELVYMLPSDFNASDAWMNILSREGSGAQLGSGQWDYEGHHGTMQVNISNCKEIQYMTQNAANSKFNSTVWSLAMDNGGAWYHIVITCDGNGDEIKAYLNSGEGFRNYTGGGMDGMYAAQDSGKFRIGATISDHTYQWADSETTDMLTKLLRGNLQEVRISEGELDQSQWLYSDTSEYTSAIGNNNQFQLKNPDNYTFGFLPDTQNTIKFTPEVSNAATEWLVKNGASIGLKGLVHEGDLVENWDDPVQWENTQNAFMPLVDAGIPFLALPGNHDSDGSHFDSYNANFGMDSEYAQKTQGDVVYENGDGRHIANYRLVNGGSYQYLLLQLPYDPTDEEFAWMESVLQKYANTPTIISSHNIFSCSDSSPDVVTLNEVGDKFWSIAKKYDSVFMMTAGHNHGSGFIDLTNDAGNPVIGMLVDYQFSYNGGNAWYRFAEMDETNNKIYFQTFSPYEASRTAEEKTSAFDVNFLTGAGNEKTYDFNFSERFDFAKPESVKITSLPDKLTYEIGEAADYTGLQVEAVTAEGARSVDLADCDITGFDSSVSGKKTITVTYCGVSASFTITVKEKAQNPDESKPGESKPEESQPDGDMQNPDSSQPEENTPSQTNPDDTDKGKNPSTGENSLVPVYIALAVLTGGWAVYLLYRKKSIHSSDEE